MKKRYAILAAIMILPAVIETLYILFHLQYPKFRVIEDVAEDPGDLITLLCWLWPIIVPAFVFLCSFIRRKGARIALTVFLCSACVIGTLQPVWYYVLGWNYNVNPFVSYTTNPKNYLDFKKDFETMYIAEKYDEYYETVKEYFPADISGIEDAEYEYSHEFGFTDLYIKLKFKATDDEIERFYAFPGITESENGIDSFTEDIFNEEFGRSYIEVKYDKANDILEYLVRLSG